MLRSSERDEHGSLVCRATGNEESDVAGCPREQGSELLVGSSVGQKLVRGFGEHELDVELGGEAGQVRARCRRRERGGTGEDTALVEREAALFEPGGDGAKLGGVRHEPGEDDDARRVAHEQLGHRKQRGDARLVGDRNENRPLRRCRRFDVERRIVPEDSPLDLLELGARLNSELVDEDAARVLIRGECLRLPARPVQRPHQIHP